MKKAAFYARSSKDKSDVSISAQRRALETLAQSRGIEIATRFEDAVFSGSTEDRPAFQQLVRAIKDRRRGWDVLLVLDTSRIARGRYIAQAFKRECARYGVTILYAKVPETDPVSTVILDAVFEAIDEVHSIMSREKGLAGMAENVRAGFRAGGRAPLGYVLTHHATGAIREGRPVMKSRLALDADAAAVGAYLKERAAGTSRALARRRHLPALGPTTLIGIEWNALCYAGHTVWNRHHELTAQGERTGRKRRPRDEWLVQRDTHPALITDLEAERILVALETSPIGAALARARRDGSRYLLGGMLVTGAGELWSGLSGRWYRLRAEGGRRGVCLPLAAIETPILARVARDLRSRPFLVRLVEGLRQEEELGGRSAEVIREEIRRLEREKSRAAQLSLQGDDGGTFFGLVQERARQISARQRELEALQAAHARRDTMTRLTIADVQAALLGREREILPEIVSRIVLEPDLSCEIQYGHADCLTGASPRGFEPLLPP